MRQWMKEGRSKEKEGKKKNQSKKAILALAEF
jgi:hypothetical protein